MYTASPSISCFKRLNFYEETHRRVCYRNEKRSLVTVSGLLEDRTREDAPWEPLQDNGCAVAQPPPGERRLSLLAATTGRLQE